MMLADYGADIVKIEAREGREFQDADGKDSYFFLSANRGKRSLTLDLKRPAGKAILLRLLEDSDVLVENFRPGVMERLGLGAEDLVTQFPRLIFCGISGFGRTGPYADRPGFDQIAQGMSGLMSLTGTPESGPTRSGIAISDLLGGLFAAQGIQLALLARERTGRGQVVDTSLLEATLGVLSWGAGMYFDRDEHPGPSGQHHPLSSPYGRFEARDGFLNLAAGNDAMWKKTCEALGHPEWRTDPRFEDSRGRVRHREELTRCMEEVLGGDDVSTWVERLNTAGVPCGPVLNLDQVFADPQVLARDMLQQLAHPVRGQIRTTGLPIKLSATPGRLERPPPLHGEHTDELLGEAGYARAEIEAFRRDEVI